ncbi:MULTISPECIES: hypothetical protein [Legionella]|uniref:Uncharacterized protein n=1 Tax=Legionella resiliens TaxID=2905958 RepID=A0ABS8X114_9GAMM|nr:MULTISPECIES: hypothetical protein [unclassified Legionella]MCE0721619.1 hypothetical protein [Legionella sp. 9fVS26]MCE3530773.1 hypothetical protein [Legionella sp. 8cVS16]QLZ70334.1 hypothetical protein FOLKNPGA_03148 [Legionella sp. PC1000]
MASVLETVLGTLGIKKQPSYTPIPQLGINNELNTLQVESQRYFAIGKDARAADDNILAIKVEQNFLTTNSHQIEFLNKCVALVKEKSMQLKSIDQKITGSVVFGVTATALSFLPVIGYIGWIGWAAAAYFINKRATAYAEYHEALTLLVGACNWSLGLGPDKRSDTIENLTKNNSIREMMAVLYPVLTETQVKHLIADDIEDVFTQELHEYEKRFQPGFEPSRFFSKKDDTIALSKKGAEFNRCIYGFNKGGVTDYLDAIVSILPDLYRAALHGWHRLTHWWQEKNTHSQDTEMESKEHKQASIS